MQISAAREHGKRFMRRGAAEARSQIGRIERFGQEFKICTVGAIDAEKCAVFFAELGYRTDNGDISEIIGGGDINRARLFA